MPRSELKTHFSQYNEKKDPTYSNEEAGEVYRRQYNATEDE